MSVAIIYLARGIGTGLPSIEAFFDAYQRCPPGYPHRLVIAIKGWESVSGLPTVIRRSREIGADIITVPDDGYDWGAYMRIAPYLEEEWICLLNTHTRPLVPGWLDLLRRPLLKPGVGAVSATGSWGSVTHPWPSFEPIISNFTLYPVRLALGYLRLLRNIGAFPHFPNPHLRSNAFMIRRKLFTSFCSRNEIPRSKRDAYKLESGRQSLTAYINSLGLRVQVVGADGHAYEHEAWIESGTFRVPGQPNLLVSDNQTRHYQQANLWIKRHLERATWGKVLTRLPIRGRLSDI